MPLSCRQDREGMQVDLPSTFLNSTFHSSCFPDHFTIHLPVFLDPSRLITPFSFKEVIASCTDLRDLSTASAVSICVASGRPFRYSITADSIGRSPESLRFICALFCALFSVLSGTTSISRFFRTFFSPRSRLPKKRFRYSLVERTPFSRSL